MIRSRNGRNLPENIEGGRKMTEFVHLHLHTQYSLLDGAVAITALFEEAQQMAMPAVAITDHGVLYGGLPFYLNAKKKGIKPIIGCEVYVTASSHLEKKGRNEDLYHLVLLAENFEGYQNLMRLVSISHLDGFYYKPRVDKDLLYKYRRGLIALTACLQGEISSHLLRGQKQLAQKALQDYKGIFGKENLFVEIQHHNLEDEKIVNPGLIELASQEELALVATNDVHYLKQEDYEAHDALLCIQTNKYIADSDRMRFPNDTFYLRSGEEMAALFEATPQAITNSAVIAERCALNLDLKKFNLPDYPDQDNKNPPELLTELCQQGLKRLKVVDEAVKQRLDYEIKIITEMGFAAYFLIVLDFINFARSKNIAVGPGRGSVAGSLTAYLLGITGINPLEYGLIFERFLNPERVTMPDIDIDFCFERRDEVIDYVTQKYGSDRVAQIITFGSMAARGAIRDVGRVLKMPYAEVDKIAKQVPNVLGITLTEALESSPVLKKKFQDDQQVKKLLELALKVEGAPRHASTHAAGVVITPSPLTDFTPLQRNKDDVITQYDMEALENIGLLKFDFLALRTLTVIDHALKLIEELHNEKVDLDNLDLVDQKTYQLLQSGQSLGVFQMESPLYQRLNREYQPDCFEDIIAIIALGRPGPMGSDRLGDFIKCRHQEQEVQYPHPLLEDILKETYGVILYQEQVMEIASKLGGFSLGEADILRRGMGKKKGDLFQQYRLQFLENATKKGLNHEKATEIFDLMEFFGGYGFNKSHSAAYAFISFQTAFLKAHYPKEFMAALLNSVMGTMDKVALYIEECQTMGIKVLPPDINSSEIDFSISQSAIRFGLGAVKNVGRKAMESILKAREERLFTSLADFCQRVDLSKVNIRVLESLIKAGAMDSLNLYRSQLMAMAPHTFNGAQKSQKAHAQGQLSLLDFLGDDGSEKVKDTTIPQLDEYNQQDMLNMEREMLGFYISGHPLDPYKSILAAKQTINIEQLKELKDQEEVLMGAVINSISIYRTRKNKDMAVLNLEDCFGQIECIVFPELYQEHISLLIEGEPLLVKGKIDKQDEDTIKVIAEEINRLACPEIIDIPLEKADENLFIKIKSILADAKGTVPVYLRFNDHQNDSILIALNAKYSCPDNQEKRKELQDTVKQLLTK